MATDTQKPPNQHDLLDPYKNLSDEEVDQILSRPRSPVVFGRRRKPVYQAPEFVKRLNAFEEAQWGSVVTFECRFKAFPKPVIKWYEGDEEITGNKKYEFEEGEEGTVKLIVYNVSKSDEGAYKCRAENVEGVATTTGYLSVSGSNGDQLLSTQDRGEHEDRCVSFPPHLRTIIEQKSMEEREEEELENQGPSPIQEFIDNIEYFKKSKTWPFLREMGKEIIQDDDELSSGSATSVDSQDYNQAYFVNDRSPIQFLDCKMHENFFNSNTEISISLKQEKCIISRAIELSDPESKSGYILGKVIEVIEFPFLYYFSFTVLSGLVGAYLECPVSLFVMTVAVIALTSFRYLVMS